MERALESASYDKLEDGTFSANVQQCPGVISFGNTLFECQANLRSTLEEWILLGLRLGHKLPRIGGIDLNQDRGKVGHHGASMMRGQRKTARI